MPVITLPPVQVSTDPQFRRPGGLSSSGVNPFYFKVGSNIYQFLAGTQNSSPTFRFGMFKRAISSVNGAWTEMDAAGSPDVGAITGNAQALYSPVTGKIAIMYTLHDLSGLKICEFDTATDTWGTPTAKLAYTVLGSTFVFVQRSDLTYVVIVTTTSAHAIYATYASGSWSSTTVLIAAGVTLLGGVIDSTDAIHFILSEAPPALSYRHLDSSFVLASTVTITATIFLGGEDIPTITLWGPASIAIGYDTVAGPDQTANVSIGTPLAAPAFTPYTVYSASNSELQTFVSVAVGIAGDLNVFFVNIDTNPHDPPLDEILWSTFDGVSIWSVPVVFYDERSNPPPNNVPNPDVNQFIHTGQYIQLPQGWTGAVTMETQDIDMNQWCTGFFLDQAPPIPGCPTIYVARQPQPEAPAPPPPPGIPQ